MHLLRVIFPALLLLSAACRVTEISSQNSDVSTDSTQLLTAPQPEVAVEKETHPYRPSRTRTHDLLHTRLEVKPLISSRQLQGRAVLQLKPYFYPQDKLVLDAKGFDIHEVSIIKNADMAGGKTLDYTYDGRQLSIRLDREYARDESYFVAINYTANPYELKSSGSEAITEDRGLYFVGTDSVQLSTKPVQVWTQGETEASSCWFPTIDAPNERTTQEIYITVDPQFKTLSNGVLVYSQHNDDSTRTDYWKMDQPHAPYLFMMAIGDFAVVEEDWRGKNVAYYVEPAYEEYADDIFGHTPEMLTFFSEKLGVEYPWPKYAQVVVRDFVSGAMENTTASVFMESLQVDDRELLDYHWDGIIAHELFHHWFGDLVTCESWANLPLNEAFATYAEYLWSEYKYGQKEADLILIEQADNYLAEAEEKKENLIRYHYASQEDMFDRHSYDKGSRILHMLRTYLGDEAFFAALQLYLNEHAYQSVEVHDLRMAFEEVSGQDLNWFFNQWFLSAGHPQLDVQHTYDSGMLTLNIRQTQDLQESALFQLPAQLFIRVNGKDQLVALDIYKQEQSWELPLAAAPELVLLDPGADLLAEISHQKSAEEWIAQYKYADAVAHQLQALQMLAADSLNENISGLMAEALEDDFWLIRQTALNLLEENQQVLNTELLNKAENMAAEDPKSLVRADALSLLASADANSYQVVFQEAMQDSSYAVVGSAVAAYNMTSAGDKLKRYESLEPYTNFNVVISLADYFVEDEIKEKYNWFEKKLQTVGEESLYYLLNYFARYLLITDENTQQEGIKLLADYAKFHPKYYIRLNAYRSLGFFVEKSGVEDLRAAIREGEKDERLRNLYENSLW
ncbi:MAG: M1 family metallopeptidase [Cyclobacteriaceae bacterium]